MTLRLDRLEEIARLALACREAQKRYFSLRTHEHLVEAKQAERSLDDALAWLEQDDR